MKPCIACSRDTGPQQTGRPRSYCPLCATVAFRIRTEAMRIVKRHGPEPHISVLTCADCGMPAHAFEHRDYFRPLDVEPVCSRCNSRRGPAITLLNNVQHFEVSA